MRHQKFFGIILILAAFCITSCGQNVKSGNFENPPKNIIIMISDGGGYNQIEAAGLYQYGQAGTQPYEQFPVILAMSTYMAGGSYYPEKAWTSFDYVKTGYTDSAAAATVMSTGAKTHSGIIGLDVSKKPQKHLAERCKEIAKAAGIVTSVPVSDATPAGFVAHNEYRKNYADIANEIFYKSSLDVIMGAGHPIYNNDNRLITEPNDWNFTYVGGKETWTDLSSGKLTPTSGDDWVVIQERSEFLALAQGPTPKRVIGIAQVNRTLQQARSGNVHADAYAVPFNQNVPTLVEMTKAALNVLDNNPNGFFLMVESGAVDWAGHNKQSGRIIEEQIDFDKAVEAVLYWVAANSNWEETLIIVTADHETGYLTGPDSGQKDSGPTWNPLVNNGKNNMPGMQWHSKDHTNSLVPFFAKGGGADLFKKAAINVDPRRGNYIDNTDIAKVIFTMLD